MRKLEIKSVLTVDDAGTITGTAWPFGTPDRVGDVIAPGAFASAPSRVPMFHEHDARQTVGVWDEIAETANGLQVKGRLLLGQVRAADEAYALVKAGAVTGLSIGFSSPVFTKRALKGRNIKSLALREISLVAVPCHDGARIGSVKSLRDDHSAVVAILLRAANTYRK